MPTSTPPWPATSAVAAPISASVRPFVAPRRSSAGKSEQQQFKNDNLSFGGGNRHVREPDVDAPPRAGRLGDRDSPSWLQTVAQYQRQELDPGTQCVVTHRQR